MVCALIMTPGSPTIGVNMSHLLKDETSLVERKLLVSCAAESLYDMLILTTQNQ